MHSVQYVSVYVSRSVCQLACYQFFSETAHRIFQKILREVRRSKCQKLRWRNFQENSDFEEKTKKVIQNSFFFCLLFVKKLIDVFTLKVVHSNFLYDCTKNQCLGKIYFSYGLRCSQPSRLHLLLIISISGRNQSISQVF